MTSPYDSIRDKLPRPKGEQAKVLALDHQGHDVVLGTAGSGKTTMAMLRALSLADPRTLHAGPTLLVTYNQTLVQFLKRVVVDGGNLEVRTFHRFARGYLNHRGFDMDDCIAEKDERLMLIAAAVNQVSATRSEAVLTRPLSFFDAEMSWLGRHGVRSEKAYLDVDRIGRKRALPTASRPAVWAVREAYEELRTAKNYRHDWDDLATTVREELDRDGDERYYLHIVVDEAQDFSLEMLRALVAALRPGGSLTLFGDAAQQIYGRGVSWRSAGIRVSKVWEFARNYRNSGPIVELAKSISAMPYFNDVDDLVRPSAEVDQGPTPALVTFSDPADEWAWIIERAKELGKVASVGVLLRRKRDVNRFLNDCRGSKKLDRFTRAWDDRPGIWVSTVHSAKGFEFQSVIIPGLDSSSWPEPMLVDSERDHDEALSNDGRLLYVAVTRCRQNLVMTASDELSDLLPEQGALWSQMSL